MKAIATFLKQWALLITGIVVSGAASLIVGGKFPWSEGLLVLLTVSVVVAVIVYIPVANHEMRSVADATLQQGSTVSHSALDLMQTIAEQVEVTASYTEQLSPDSEGAIYQEITRLVSEAEQSVIIVVKMEGGDMKTGASRWRKAYLNALESKAENRGGSRFTYIRIYQGVRSIPESVDNGELSGESLRHVIHMLKIRQRLDDELKRGMRGVNPADVSIMVTDKYLMDASFMVVDGRHLAIEIDSIDISGDRYAAGFLIIHDRGKQIVPRILAHVAILTDHAHPIRIEDLAVNVSAVREADTAG